MLNNLGSDIANAINIFDANGQVAKYKKAVVDDRSFKEVKKGVFPFRKKVKVFDYDNSFYLVSEKKNLTTYYDAGKQKFTFVVDVQQGDTPKITVKFEFGKTVVEDSEKRKEIVTQIIHRMADMLEKQLRKSK